MATKQKSVSGAKKRFKRAASGKIKRKNMNRRHNLGGKGQKVKRQMRGNKLIHASDQRRVSRMLGDE